MNEEGGLHEIYVLPMILVFLTFGIWALFPITYVYLKGPDDHVQKIIDLLRKENIKASKISYIPYFD